MPFQRKTCVLWPILFASWIAAAPTARAQVVTLPLSEYESLRRRAEPRDDAAPSPPVPVALESAEIEINVGRDNARVTIRMTLAIYEEGWQRIDLPSDGNLTLIELGALDGHVRSGGASARALSCRGIGRHDVRIESVVAAKDDSSAARPTRTVALALPLAATVTGVVASDVETDEVTLLSGAYAQGPAEPGRQRFVGEPGASFEARLLGELDTASGIDLPLFFDASSAAMTHVERSGVELIGFLELDVVQGRMDEIRVPVPRGMNVLAVESPNGVELGWDLDPSGALVVRFSEPSAGTVPIALSLGSAGDRLDHFEAPLLVPDGASRLALVSGLSVAEDGIPILLRAASARRAEREDIEFIPPSIVGNSASLFVVRDSGERPEWRVEWAEADPTSVLASQVDRLVVDALIGESGRVAYQYWAVVRSPGALSLTVRPPDGFELTATKRAGRRVTPGRSSDGLVVPLSAGPEPQIVFVSGLMDFVALPKNGIFEIPVPAFSAPVARVEVRVVLPGERRYDVFSESMDSYIGEVPSRSWFAVPAGHRVVTASWSALSARPGPLSIQTKTKRDKRRWY